MSDVALNGCDRGTMLSSSPVKPRENLILSALPPEERALLAPELDRIPLTLKQVLQEPRDSPGHLWFPRSGVVSMTSMMDDGSIVEVATIGREGMVGLSAVLGAGHLSQMIFVQIPGDGDRLPVAAFERLLRRLPGLHATLLRYTGTLVTQIAQGSACNRLHPIEARCARWLLMTHDRVDGDRFPLTHEFLAQMLGVTRPSVTIAAGILQKAGLIRYVRGVIDILDRERLEEAACECYGVIILEFRRLFKSGRGG